MSEQKVPGDQQIFHDVVASIRTIEQAQTQIRKKVKKRFFLSKPMSPAAEASVDAVAHYDF